MTAALARFVGSTEGEFYAAVCERYGVDPAPEGMPDVLAFNLRAGLALSQAKRQRVANDEAAARAGDPLAKARQAERFVKSHTAGDTVG
jgi:hypothetical protein